MAPPPPIRRYDPLGTSNQPVQFPTVPVVAATNRPSSPHPQATFRAGCRRRTAVPPGKPLPVRCCPSCELEKKENRLIVVQIHLAGSMSVKRNTPGPIEPTPASPNETDKERTNRVRKNGYHFIPGRAEQQKESNYKQEEKNLIKGIEVLKLAGAIRFSYA